MNKTNIIEKIKNVQKELENINCTDNNITNEINVLINNIDNTIENIENSINDINYYNRQKIKDNIILKIFMPYIIYLSSIIKEDDTQQLLNMENSFNEKFFKEVLKNMLIINSLFFIYKYIYTVIKKIWISKNIMKIIFLNQQ